MSFATFGKFLAIISLGTFSAHSILSFYESNDTNIRNFVIVAQVSESQLLKNSICSLLFKSGPFYCFIWQSTDCFLRPFYSMLSSSVEF